MGHILQDVRHGLKSLLITPKLTFAALACIVLGIGSVVFLLTLINAVFLRQPPFPEAERLARIWLIHKDTQDRGDLSFLDFQDIKNQVRSYEVLEMTARTRLAVMANDGTERMRGEAVTPGYFRMIGIQPALGHLFPPEAYEPDAHPVAIIGHDMWQRKYGGRPDILGQSVKARSTQDGRETIQLHTIVGVMPPGFIGTVEEDISEFWIPAEQFTPRRFYEDRRGRIVWALARLKPGVSLDAAQAEIAAVERRLAAEYPESYEKLSLRVEPFGENWREKLRTGLVMLMVAALLLLVIACTNIANLLLARLVQREHELTLRIVLGAQRGRILRQLLTESLVLSFLGGAIGILLTFWGINAFVRAEVIKLPQYIEVSPDGRVIGLAILLVLLTGILFGVLPAWFGAQVNASQRLREASRGMSLGRRERLHGQVLVVLEVTFTFVLLIGSVLMLRTYHKLLYSDLGFRTDHLLRMAISLDPTEYSDGPAQLGFARDAKTRLEAYPGVRKVSFVAGVLPPWEGRLDDIVLNGATHNALENVDRHAIDTDFLEVMDISLLYGRNVQSTDRAETPPVALVSQTLARSIAEGDERGAIGKPLQVVTNVETRELSPPIEIVGVVEDVRYRGPLSEREIDYDLYIPMEQAPQAVLSMAIHTEVDPAALLEPLQRELGRMAPTSPRHWISTMEEELALQYQDARFYAWLTGVYAASALLLAILGIYSVLANSVSRRFRELGIRMAVGAQGGDIVRLVLNQGARTLIFGLLMGAGLAILGTKLVESLLYGVTPSDPVTFALVGAALLILGLIACYLPARRATRADPLIVLRGE